MLLSQVEKVEPHTALELTEGDSVSVETQQGVRLLLLAGKPLNEPIAQ